MKPTDLLLFVLALCGLAAGLDAASSPSTAAGHEAASAISTQDPQPTSRPADAADDEADEDADADDDDDATSGPPLVIRGGDLHLGTGSILRRADLLVENGKIAAIGHDLEVPDDAEQIDATGMVVAPGFVIPRFRRGCGVPSRVGKGMEKALNPFDPTIKMALAAGITSVFPYADGGSDKPKGYGRIVKMAPEDVDAMASGPADTVVSMSVPLTPKDIRDLEALVRESREYIVERDAAKDAAVKRAAEASDRGAERGDGKGGEKKDEGTEDGESPADESKPKKAKKAEKPKAPKPPRGAEGLIRVLDGDARLWISGTRSMNANELRQAVEIAELLDVGVVLDRPYTAWTDPSPIARTGSMVLLDPREQVRPDPNDPDETGSNLATAAILHEAGVPIAVTCPTGWFGGASLGLNGLLGQDLHTPFVDAAFAVRGGMPNRAALRTLTIDAARLVGAEDRLGSLEVGKDADILLLDGDPLHYKSFVQVAIVNGRVVYRKADEPFYSHIR